MTGAYPVLHLGPVRSTRPWARTYRGTPASVPEARRFVGELLAGSTPRGLPAQVRATGTEPGRLVAVYSTKGGVGKNFEMITNHPTAAA